MPSTHERASEGIFVTTNADETSDNYEAQYPTGLIGLERKGPVDLESDIERIERLGRERPAQFKTIWAELAFLFSIFMSQILTEYFVSGFTVVLPTLIDELQIPSAAVVWPASAFSLVVASTLLVFGRLGDMFGGFFVYLFGLAWLLLWSVVAGFSRNPLMLDFCRALQGLGPAAFLPAGVMLLGGVYRPGPRKNLAFSLYGACAVVGFYIGIFFAGLTGQFIFWGWYFWIGAALAGITLVTSYLSIPKDYAEKKKNNIAMDWYGSVFITCGLVLVVYSITDSMHSPHGWRTPYIPVLLVVGCIFLGIAVYVEGWVAMLPLLPSDMFQVPSMKPLIMALTFSYGTLGIWMFYTVLYMENCMGAAPLQVVAWFVPMVIGGLVLSTVGGFVLHLIPGTGLLLVSGIGWIGANILLAVIPHGGSYWAYILPSMVLGSIGIDITFSIANIFVTTQLPSERQGLAGAVLNSIMHLGIALLLGFTDIVQTSTSHKGLCRSYHDTFWFGTACASVAFVILVLFVKVDKAKSDLTADEKRAFENEAREPDTSGLHEATF
ncbi:putative drug resistance protein [Phaeomoniella chlamydospora]|uniref:Putative drug resistance protein n=1 Tax=Phaeomoniella chlamydospora TaxID=158046 RepID=A0A0G2GUT2_PHACM|nr:putative drug resistance protein [Phaeomoniella chlamydospora]